ncbi:hypothetical protein M5X00_28560 [Paenibacillus alvei]|uniref:Uncharacterized protein n=1 Tax=Paenibacillus alvei TaxID=44250 RepID=A0ABT4H3D1_PAEAL|nr:MULTISPECIES: hypothetical protein [Paenibacillus]MCY7484374.1 hypothetical protein [Paenibacillus alvei]MCY9543661.1 hypothetical protein [Paenibacillus alvei]MCY9706822.1 hypothetical protein [Paenibacillus alvei]MCY9737222.1 hypothetical protein [Paenibacillus alvei]MCY9758179.1 hypothetical protein [Paenibacillus alvei]
MNKNVSYTLRAFLFIPFGVVLQSVPAAITTGMLHAGTATSIGRLTM